MPTSIGRTDIHGEGTDAGASCPNSPHRRRFQELAFGVRRQLGIAEPPHTEPDQRMSVRLTVDGIPFELIHIANEGEAGERFVLQCLIGIVSGPAREEVLRDALTISHGLARANAGMLALSVERDELVYSLLQPLEGQDEDCLLAGMRQIAEHASRWRAAHPSSLH